jgi:hypothetical protein
MKPLSNSPGLSESQQFDFIKSIDATRLPRNDSDTRGGVHFFGGEIVILVSVWQKEPLPRT